MSSFISYVDDMNMTTYCNCIDCGSDDATAGMGNLCADCYWDKDSQRKKEQRADPVWRLNRIVSFALTFMNMDNASAIAFALKTMNLDASPLNEKK